MTPSGFSVMLNKKRKLLWMWGKIPSEIVPTVFYNPLGNLLVHQRLKL
jgi:hypothetical protein